MIMTLICSLRQTFHRNRTVIVVMIVVIEIETGTIMAMIITNSTTQEYDKDNIHDNNMHNIITEDQRIFQ